MRYPSLRNIINIYLILIPAFLFSQQSREQRLYLQYLSWQCADSKKKDSIELLVANAYLDEANYSAAVAVKDGIKEKLWNKDMKLFLSGKAEFLRDNYEGSLSFFEVMDKKKLGYDFPLQADLFSALDHIHLLHKTEARNIIAQTYLETGKDTAGIFCDFDQLRIPHQYNLVKARRRSSFLPGSGLYYVGEKRSAAGSLFLNLFFLGYTGYSIFNHYYITSVLTGATQFLRFYHGSKRAAYKIGNNKNREAYLEFIMNADEKTQKLFFELKK